MRIRASIKCTHMQTRLLFLLLLCRVHGFQFASGAEKYKGSPRASFKGTRMQTELMAIRAFHLTSRAKECKSAIGAACGTSCVEPCLKDIAL